MSAGHELVLVWESDESTGGFYALREFGRTTNVEGFAHEWKDIAECIKARRSVSFKRCAVSFAFDGFADFRTPRNAYGPDDKTTLSNEEADALADQIVRLLSENGERCMFIGFDPIAMGM